MNALRSAGALMFGVLTLVLLCPQRVLAQSQGTPGASASSAMPDASAALKRAFGTQTLQPEWFSPAFTALLPQVQAGVTGFQAQFGALVRVEGPSVAGAPDTYRLIYARGSVTVRATVEAGIFTALVVVNVTPGQSDPARLSALTRLFSAQSLRPEWFAPSLLSRLPFPQLEIALAQGVDGLGAFRGARFEGGYVLTFERAKVPVRSLELDDRGRFVSLLLGPPQSTSGVTTLEDVIGEVQKLPGQTGLIVTRLDTQGPTEVAAFQADTALAVGSAFKLAVLAELQAQVKAGRLHWSDTATLTDADKSLPSGTLQNQPSGSAYTLQALAEAMVSVSDNTAADLLLRIVGRAGVEARLGEAPMLSTRELFALKNPANSALLARYLRSNGEARRAVLAEADRAPLPTALPLTLALGAEWHVSVRRLCTLMNEVAPLPLTTLNPGVADPSAFGRISFKGGSDDGVVNLTTQVVTRNGQTYCVSATWNDTRPVSVNRLSLVVQDTLHLLENGTR